MNISKGVQKNVLCTILLSTCLSLCGCKYSIIKNDESSFSAAASPTAAITAANAVSPSVTVTPTEAAAPTENISPTVAAAPTENISPTEAVSSVISETLVFALTKDIDCNDIMDAIQIVEREDGSEFINVLFNGAVIYQYEWTNMSIISFGAFEYLDLDQDKENEIFITVYPMVNSRPLIEVLTLKQIDGQWNQMEIPVNELGNNYFPVTITRGAEEFDFVISSELTDQQVIFDASSFYKDDGTIPNRLQEYRQNHYKEGDEVAYTPAWGIWEAQTGTCDGRNCIIAQQGIEASYNNFLGRVFIYYAYDRDGSIEILKLEYKKYNEF